MKNNIGLSCCYVLTTKLPRKNITHQNATKSPRGNYVTC